MKKQIKDVESINTSLELNEIEQKYVGLELELITVISDYMLAHDMSFRELSRITDIHTRMLHYYFSGKAKDCLVKLLFIANKLGFSGSLTLKIEPKITACSNTGESYE